MSSEGWPRDECLSFGNEHVQALGIEASSHVSTEIERQNMAALLEHFDNFIAREERSDGSIGKLRPYQADTLRKERDFISSSIDKQDVSIAGLCNLACSSGKSAVAIYTALAAGAGKINPDGTKRQAGLYTSRSLIVDQLARSNFQEGTDHDEVQQLVSDFEFFAPNLRVTVCDRFSKDMTGDVVIMTYQGIPSLVKGGQLYPGRFKLQLLDEEHNVGFQRAQILQELGQDAVTIGLSATPKKLSGFLETEIDKVSMLEGILKYKFLSAMQVYGMGTGEIIYGSNNSEYTSREVDLLSDSLSRNQLIVETVRYGVSHLGPGIVKCAANTNGDHIQKVTRLIRESGPIIDKNGVSRPIRVEAVGDYRRDSSEVIRDFSTTDAIDVLVYVSMIGEGLNARRIRFGVYGTPTKSENSLAQFMGRGGRMDGDNKIFTAFQLIDMDVIHPERMAMVWDLFDCRLRMLQGLTIRPRTYNRLDPQESLAGEAPSIENEANNAVLDSFDTIDTLGESAVDQLSYRRAQEAYDEFDENEIALAPLSSYMPETLRKSIQGAKHPVQLALETYTPDRVIDSRRIVYPLHGLETEIGLPSAWLQRILFNNDFTTTVALDPSHIPEFYYREDALRFLDDTVAHPDDISMPEAASRLGMDKATLFNRIQASDIAPRYVYPIEMQDAARVRPHLRPSQFERLAEISTERRPLQPHEIDLSEVRTRTGMQNPRFGEFFRIRGFNIQKRSIKGRTGRPAYIGLRKELEPWVDSYNNAQPRPDKGFSYLFKYTTQTIEGTKPTFTEVFTAARRLKLKLYHFHFGDNRRGEFIKEEHVPALRKMLADIIISRSEHFTSDDIQAASGASRRTVIAQMAQLGILGMRDNTGRYPKEHRDAVMQAVQEAMQHLAIFDDEPTLRSIVFPGQDRFVTFRGDPNDGAPQGQPLAFEATTESESAFEPPPSSKAEVSRERLEASLEKRVVSTITPRQLEATIKGPHNTTARTANKKQQLSSMGYLQLPQVSIARPANLSAMAMARNSAIALLVAVHRRHPETQHEPLGVDRDGNVITTQGAHDVLQTVMRTYASGNRFIPPTWALVDDLAQSAGLDSGQLSRAIVAKNFDEDVVRYVNITEVGGVLVFCSPVFCAGIMHSVGLRPKGMQKKTR